MVDPNDSRPMKLMTISFDHGCQVIRPETHPKDRWPMASNL